MAATSLTRSLVLPSPRHSRSRSSRLSDARQKKSISPQSRNLCLREDIHAIGRSAVRCPAHRAHIDALGGHAAIDQELADDACALERKTAGLGGPVAATT